jgi:hypothetical protein
MDHIDIKSIVSYSNPSWVGYWADWQKWRLCALGGEAFRDRYLTQFSRREDENDFQVRRQMSPIPTFAKAAVTEIRNAIYQRLTDVTRVGGSQSYQDAVTGLHGGVDQRGSSMGAFLGVKVLTDLMVMGKIGIFVDAPKAVGPTMKDAIGARPYLYAYSVEDIINFTCNDPAEPSEFQALLVRDTVMEYSGVTLLPTTITERYRHMWLDAGQVMVQYYDKEGNSITEPERLELTRIPFVLLDLGDSLIKDVADHQIALLNLSSSDLNYALKANFPFYTQQEDLRAAGSHLKQVETATGTATAGGQGSANKDVAVGVTQGIRYDLKTDRPGFINPSSEPLKASLELGANLKQEIRELVNLAVMTLATRASAESKSIDNQGLEAGLSYIGLVLENAERKVAEFWAAYEERNESKRQLPTIRYPDRYSLKTDADRIKEANDLSKLMQSVPGQTVKREIAKSIVQSLLGGKVNVDTIAKINTEIQDTPYTTSDPNTILQAVEKGLCGEETGSLALGFGPDEYKQAQKDHSARVARIAEAQGINSDPAARGVKDLSANANAGNQEKKTATDVTMNDTTKSTQRGPAAEVK